MLEDGDILRAQQSSSLKKSGCPTINPSKPYAEQKILGVQANCIYDSNYTSALLHGHTAHFKSQWDEILRG